MTNTGPIQQQGLALAASTTTTTQVEEPVVLRLHPDNQTPTAAKKKRLRGKKKPRVRWTEDVVDNENMDKKKSKICCIFHPQREFGEHSDSDLDLSGSSDSASDSDSADVHEGCSHHHAQPRPSSPNAYERQPHYKPKEGDK
jgi:protein phosphatase 1 regulatory subunit 11